MTDTVPKIAVHKAVKEEVYKSLSEQLEVGQHIVDCRVQLRGALKKGNPFKTKVPAAANPWRLLAVALSKLNQTSVDAVVRESLAMGEEQTTAVKKAAEDAITRIVAATERESSGRITGEVILEIL